VTAATIGQPDFGRSVSDHRIHGQIRMIENDISTRLGHGAKICKAKQWSEITRYSRTLELLNTIMAAANQSSDPDFIVAFAVEEICKVNGWPIGNAFIVSGEEGGFYLQAIGRAYACEPERAASFLRKSNQLICWPSVDLPSQLLYNPVPCFVEKLAEEHSFPQLNEALELGLSAMIAIPILLDNGLIGAFEFFLGEHQQLASGMTETLMKVADQVSHVFRRKREEDNLQRRALRDVLTGLPNRTAFEHNLKLSFETNHANEESGPTLIFIDLDGFKLINDTMGHRAGDDLLVEVAKRLARLVSEFEATERLLMRHNDHILLARIGGDEFTMMINGPNKQAFANEIAQAVHDSLKPPYRIDGQSVSIGASIGIAHDDGHYRYPDELLRDADVAMYEAKTKTNCRTVLFDQAMRDIAIETLRIEADLRKAIKSNEFELHFQPIVALADERPVGLEALLRWRRSTGDLVYPDTFIGIAEDTGLISEIGNWALRKACETLQKLAVHQSPARSLFMSVNVSTRQFLDPDFPNHVREIIRDTQIDPSRLVLEVTESAAIINPAQTAQILERLRSWKINIGLDDFGTGYSSLSHLQTLHFDAIKIDKSFIIHQSTENENWSIVDAILRLANALELKVVAEGIESRFQLDKLKEMGCILGQGYLFSHPLEEEKLISYLQSRIN
jgi:diguanylate cyclase (GGDEF)-like protein